MSVACRCLNLGMSKVLSNHEEAFIELYRARSEAAPLVVASLDGV